MRWLLLLLFSSSGYAHNYDIKDFLKEERVDSITCLAYNAYHEARGEANLANIVIMSTVMNRVASPIYEDTVCGVIKEHKQYSWTSDGRSDAIPEKRRDRYDRLYRLAEYFLIHKDELILLADGATHYHATRIRPYWYKTKQRLFVLGNHIFYRNK